MKRLFTFCLTTLLLLVVAGGGAVADAVQTVSAADPAFSSYTYDYWGSPVSCPAPYTLSRSLTGVDVGVGDWKRPNDVFVDGAGYLYIAVSGDQADDNYLLKLDSTLRVVMRLYGCTDEAGETVRFREPTGVFVTEEGEIYLADGISQNIYHMTADGTHIRTIAAPVSDDSAIIHSEFTERYRPSKLVVDFSGRIQVVASNVNEGIVKFDPEGQFEGFLAAGKVNVSAIDLLWRRFSTKEQLERMTTPTPIEYNNITLDNEGFLFVSMAAVDEAVVLSEIRAGTGTEQGALVRRLNLMGTDILKRNGFGAPVGDYDIVDTVDNMDAAYQGISHIADVACGDNRCYTLLDNNRCRLFTYTASGTLLYAFNGPDITAGGLATPCSVAMRGDKLYILDGGTHRLVEMTRTAFGNAIAQAIACEDGGQYDAAAALWEQVLRRNGNYDPAYSGLGRAYYQQGRYQEAMDMFRTGNDRPMYARAFQSYSKQLVSAYFAPVMGGVLAVAAVLCVLNLVRKRKQKRAQREDVL